MGKTTRVALGGECAEAISGIHAGRPVHPGPISHSPALALRTSRLPVCHEAELARISMLTRRSLLHRLPELVHQIDGVPRRPSRVLICLPQLRTKLYPPCSLYTTLLARPRP